MASNDYDIQRKMIRVCIKFLFPVCMGLLCTVSLVGNVVINLAFSEELLEKEIWSVNGVVVEPLLTPKSMLIKHEELPGLMPAMTMPFTLPNPSLADGISHNDNIRFTFSRVNETFRIERITVLSSQIAQNTDIYKNSVSNVKSDRFLDPSLPSNLALTNHHGHKVTLDEYRDKSLLINFIYTRCPSICPAQTIQLKEVLSNFDDREKEQILFISVSLDHGHDSPRILTEYAKKHAIDLKSWVFLTGDKLQVERLMNSLNVASIPINDAAGSTHFSHSPNIFLVGNNGNTVTSFDPSEASFSLEVLHQGLLDLL